MDENKQQATYTQKRKKIIQNLLKNGLIFFYLIKDVLYNIKTILKKHHKSNKAFSLFYKIFSLPISLMNILNIIVNKKHSLPKKIFKVSMASTSKTLGIVSWIGKIAFKLAEKTLNIFGLIRSILSLFKAVVTLSKTSLSRFKKRKIEKEKIFDLEQQIKEEHEKLAAMNKESRTRDALLQELEENKQRYQQLRTKIEKSKRKFIEKLKTPIHDFILGGLYLAASIMLFIPATLPVSLIMFTALSTYESVYGVLEPTQQMGPSQVGNTNSNQDFKTKAITFFKKIINQPPMSLIIIASAVVAVTLTLLTGPIGATIFSVALGVFSLGMIIKKRNEIRKIFSPKKKTKEEEEIPLEPINLNTTSEIKKSLSQKKEIKAPPSACEIETEEAKLNPSINNKQHYKPHPIRHHVHGFFKLPSPDEVEPSFLCKEGSSPSVSA